MIVIPDEGPQSPLKSPAILNASEILPASPPPYPTASTQPLLQNQGQSGSRIHYGQAPQNDAHEYETITLHIPRVLVPANDEPSVKARMRFLVSLGLAMVVFIILSAFFSSISIPRHGRVRIPSPSPLSYLLIYFF